MEEKRNYTVYMHVNKENGKVYIGITSQEVERRWGYEGNGYKNQPYFHRAIKKHGWNNFEHIVLFENKTRKEAEKLEILFIKILMSNSNSSGYNIENGGNAKSKVTEETRKKLSEANKGKQLSNEHKQKISQGNKGRKFSDQTKLKISKANKGRIISPEIRQAMSDAHLNKFKGGDNPNARQVICDNKIFGSMTECADYYDLNISNISAWLIQARPMPQEFIDLGLQYFGDGETIYTPQYKQQKRKVICNNKTFDSITQCSIFYNVKRSKMNSWLTGNTKMPQKFINLNLRYLNDNDTIYLPQNEEGRVKKVICNGQIFNSITECADFYNVTRSVMSRWLSGTRKMLQEFKDMGLSYYIEENENIEQSA